MAMSHTLFSGKFGVWSPDFSGFYRIRFITQDENQVAVGNRRVRLYDEASGKLLQESRSDSNGNGQFAYLAARPMSYVLIACKNVSEDGQLDYPAIAIADYATPEPML